MPFISAPGKPAALPSSPNPNFAHVGTQLRIGRLFTRTLSGRTPPPGAPHGGFYTRFAIVLPRVPLIVSAAAQAKILNRARTARGPRVHMVEL